MTASDAGNDEQLRAYASITGRMRGFLYRCRNDADYTMLVMTEGIHALCGYPASEFIDNRQRTFASILHPEDVARVDAAVAVGLQSRSNWAVDYRLMRRDGTSTWAHEVGGGVYDPADKLLYLEGFIIGVDDRKLLEQRNKALLEGVSDISRQIVSETSDILGVLRALKMLGFNARVEAARAADQGSAFGVVAHEITNLANASAEATRRITRLMDRLQALLTES